jgi:hypothetical protein
MLVVLFTFLYQKLDKTNAGLVLFKSGCRGAPAPMTFLDINVLHVSIICSQTFLTFFFVNYVLNITILIFCTYLATALLLSLQVFSMVALVTLLSYLSVW